jgi:hypothetical protein
MIGRGVEVTVGGGGTVDSGASDGGAVRAGAEGSGVARGSDGGSRTGVIRPGTIGISIEDRPGVRTSPG